MSCLLDYIPLGCQEPNGGSLLSRSDAAEHAPNSCIRVLSFVDGYPLRQPTLPAYNSQRPTVNHQLSTINRSPHAPPSPLLLTPSQCAEIHAASLHILETAGVRVDSPRARHIFAGSGGCRLDEDRVYLSPELVESALKSAPPALQVYNRRGEPAFRLGARSAPASASASPTCTTRTRSATPSTPFTRRHMASSVRLGEASCPAYDVISTIGILQDYPPEIADLYAVLEMVANTRKPLVMLISDEGLFPPALDLLEHLHGDLAAQPFVVPYFNPITPLIINEGTGDKMLDAHRARPAVDLLQLRHGGHVHPHHRRRHAGPAERRAAGRADPGAARQPGAPVILGSLPAYFDMRTMVDFYDPHSMLINLACAEMMAHYGLPHAGTSGSGIGWGADLLAAGALWMNQLTSSLGRSGLAPFVGGNLGSKAFSPSTAVYADELIAMARDFDAGYPLDATSIALDELIAGVSEGHFLSQPETLKYFGRKRKGKSPQTMDPGGAYHRSRIFPRWGLENWQDSGAPLALDFLKQRTLQLLAESLPPDDQADLLARGEAFIARLVL